MGSHFLLQRVFPTQGLNQHLIHLLNWQADSLLSKPSPNQTWIFSLFLSKVNLLTAGWSGGKCSVYCKANQEVREANVQERPKLPNGFSIQFSSVAQSCLTLCDLMNCACQASLSITNSLSLPKLMSIESVMPSNHLTLCYLLLLLPSIFPRTRVFSSESALSIRWPKFWNFSFNISPSNEQPGLMSFRMDLLDLLAAQGPLKSFLQHHSSKASILWLSAFFIANSHIHTWLLEKP